MTYGFDEATNRRASATQPEGTWSYNYNARGEVTGGTHPKPGRNFAYGYDAIGNREWGQVNGQNSIYTTNGLNQYVQRTVPGVLEVRGSVAGSVNGLGALIDGQPAPLSGRDFYRALSVDNSAAAVWKSVDIWAWGDNDGQEVETHEQRAGLVPKTPEVIEYDADGNLTKDGQWCYQWDAENRLVRMYRYMPQGWTTWPAFKVWELTFHYDWQGRRVLKRVNPGGREENQRSVQFAYDGWNVVAERETVSAEEGWSTATTTLRRYVWGADLSGTLQGAGGVGGLLAETFTDDYGEHTLLPAYDGNGNIVAMLDGAGGAVRAEYSYGPFGEPLRATGAMAKANPFRFSTKYCDEETGLCYYGYRYYQPTTGRWLSRDPIAEDGGTHLYGFVENRPTEENDVLGLVTRTIVVASGPDIARVGGEPYFAYNFGGVADNKEVAAWVVKELGYLPPGLALTKTGSPMTEQALSLWRNQVVQEQKDKGEPCCHEVTFAYRLTLTAADAKAHLSGTGDAFMLFAHGGAAHAKNTSSGSGETGLYFEIRKPPRVTYPVSAAHLLSLIVPDIKSLQVGSCRDAGLPKRVGDVGIDVLTVKPTMGLNYGSDFSQKVKDKVKELCRCK